MSEQHVSVEVVDGRPDDATLLGLYDDAGWVAYSRDPAALLAAWAGSRWCRTASLDGEVVGIARSVGDGQTIAYLQDVIVHSEHRRRGVGQALVAAWLADHAHVRQRLLLTDADAGQRAFYHACGLTDVDELGLVTFGVFG